MELKNNPTNKQLCDTMINIALSTVMKLDSNENFNSNLVNKRPFPLGYSILNKFNKVRTTRLVSELIGKPEVQYQWVLKPARNSILSAINYTRVTEGMSSLNLKSYSDETVTKLRDKLEKELIFYKDKVLKEAKIYINKVGAYNNTTKSADSENMFSVKLFSMLEIANLMAEKDCFDPVDYKLEEITTFDLSMIDCFGGTLSDMELQVERDEELKSFHNKDSISEYINEVLGCRNVDSFLDIMEETTLININGLILLSLSLAAEMKNTTDQHIPRLLNIVNNKIMELKQLYDIRVRNKTLVIGYERDDDGVVITLLKSTYTNEIFNLKAIYGAVLNVSSYNEIGSFRYSNMFGSVISSNVDENVEYYNNFVSSMIIENRNNTNARMINYYVYALSVITDDQTVNEISSDVEAYLTTLNLSEIIDIKTVTMNIFKNILYKETNFGLFLDGLEDSKVFTNNDDFKINVSYAAFHLILKYLYVQTETI